MKKAFKLFKRMLLVLMLILLCLGACGFLSIRKQLSQGIQYSEAIENMILDMIPEDGIVVQGRYYGYWGVKGFLDEIRYDPNYYEHKNHHCVLAGMPDHEIHTVVSFFRFVMGCR